MALPKISVDDRTYANLLQVLRKQIPGELWSDHNPSDPGIMLLELLTWLGEMALYRMDRVPQSHTDKFVNLVIDPPEPATVEVTFQLDRLPGAPPADENNVVIPAGTRLATDFALDPVSQVQTRYIFETLIDAILVAPRQDIEAQTVTVTAREVTVITDELLGVSDESPNQSFRLDPQHGPLGLAEDHPIPVLLDFVNNVGGYQPNPVVSVGGTPWDLKQFLLTADSRVDAGAPGDTPHFMVEPHENLVRFGDRVFGSIPSDGAEIRCQRYQVLLGPKALIREGDLQHILDPIADPGTGLLDGERLVFSHSDAQGGFNYFAPERRTAEGLAAYHNRFRLVSDEDFHSVLLDDFNAYQDMLGAPEKILRVVVLMNRQPPLADGLDAPGHVTILILAHESQEALDNLLRDPGVSFAAKQGAIDLSQDFVERVTRFLDRRRLITTRLHFDIPVLTAVDIAVHAVIERDRDVIDMRSVIEEGLRDFINILSGGFDGVGWPLGRNVYRSKLFRLIEELDGVDHVASLTLSPANPDGDVEIGPQALPVLQAVTVTLERV